MKRYSVKISIIMTAYNQERYVSESIESILLQNFNDFELIIINDCSNDNTLKIIKSYAAKDKRIKLIDNHTNVGYTKSLNKGLMTAKGKYIAILDSDDIALQNSLKNRYRYLENNKNIFLIGGGINYIDENSKQVGHNIPIQGFENIKRKLQERNCFWHPTIMFRNAGKLHYREKFIYAQDYDLYTQMITSGLIIENLPEVFSNYRIHSKSASYSKRTIQSMFVSKIADFYKQRLKTGSDNYKSFNPKDILNFKPEESTDRHILRTEAHVSWSSNNFIRARYFANRYIKYHGFDKKMLSYIILSFFGKWMINLVRRLKNKTRR